MIPLQANNRINVEPPNNLSGKNNPVINRKIKKEIIENTIPIL
jgi:hypothetical protein